MFVTPVSRANHVVAVALSKIFVNSKIKCTQKANFKNRYLESKELLMSNHRILHTMLRVGFLDKSIEFYTQVMGMSTLRKMRILSTNTLSPS